MFRSASRSGFGAVTSRGHRRREEFLKKSYPNAPTHRPSQLPRKGSRGAWISQPNNIEDLGQLFGTNIAQQAWYQEREEKVDSILDRVAVAEENGSLMDLFDEHLRTTQAIKAAQPTAETFRKKHIEMLIRKPPENPVYEGHKKMRVHDTEPVPLLDPDTPSAPSSVGRKSNVKKNLKVISPDADTLQDLAPLRNMRTTSLADLWTDLGAAWVEVQDCIVPSRFEHSTIEAYDRVCADVGLTDVSYRNLLLLEGDDREVVGDHFLTAGLRKMCSGDAQYACILDSKGYVLDTCFVLKSPAAILLLTEGAHGVQLLNYLSDYIAFARQSGLDVNIRPEDATVLELNGPKAGAVLSSSTAWPFPQTWIEKMPQMSFYRLNSEGDFGGCLVMRSQLAGVPDGFTYVCTAATARGIATDLLATHGVQPVGHHCMDILRLEAGHPRTAVDIKPGIWSPVRTSLAWTIDHTKLRTHILFGHDRIFNQLAKGPSFRRVGFIVDGFVHSGCRILSNPSRSQIGVVTSSVWSLRLNARIAMGYVKPEYAKEKKDVLFNVLLDLPTDRMVPSRIKFWIRQGDMRSAYRRLVPGKVCTFPFRKRRNDHNP